jgi:hypothetical protein
MLWILFSIIVIFNALDVYQTWLLLETGLSEANPLLCYFINRYGFFMGVIPVKAVFLSLLAVGIAFRTNKTYNS